MCSHDALFLCARNTAQKKDEERERTQPSSSKKKSRRRRRKTMMQSKRGPEPDARDEKTVVHFHSNSQFPRARQRGEEKRFCFIIVNIPRISPSNSGRTRANGRRPAETPPAARPLYGTSCRSPPGAYEPSP